MHVLIGQSSMTSRDMTSKDSLPALPFLPGLDCQLSIIATTFLQGSLPFCLFRVHLPCTTLCRPPAGSEGG
jgi:hypothetical protein